jgi:hypothetical protein
MQEAHMKNFREHASHREARDVPTTSSMPSLC